MKTKKNNIKFRTIFKNLKINSILTKNINIIIISIIIINLDINKIITIFFTKSI